MDRQSRSRGFTLIEAVLALAITAVLVHLASLSIQNLGPKYRLERAVWDVRSALNTARTKAVIGETNYRLRLMPEGWTGWILEKYDPASLSWRAESRRVLEGVTVEANNTPVFTPAGAVTNLATITVANSWGGYKITIAITGRIKVARLPP